MTIFYPDISSFQAGLHLTPGTAAVFAKASEGSFWQDSTYYTFRAQAQQIGAVFGSYHYLHAGSWDTQAANAMAMTGGAPLMIDVEQDSGGVADIIGFANAYRARGGVVNLVYLPHWYWNQIGSPSLTPLLSAGLHLVSSNYAAYSDTGPGWDAYGGVYPSAWQYSDNLPYAGTHVDFNAFKGTIEQFSALIGYGTTDDGDDMPNVLGPLQMPTGNNMQSYSTHWIGMGAFDAKRTWLDVWSDLAGNHAAFRVAVGKGDGTYYTIVERVEVTSGQVWTLQLPVGARGFSIVRLPYDANDTMLRSVSMSITTE